MILFYKYIFWDTVYIYGLQTNGTKTLKCKNTYKYEAQFFSSGVPLYLQPLNCSDPGHLCCWLLWSALFRDDGIDYHDHVHDDDGEDEDEDENEEDHHVDSFLWPDNNEPVFVELDVCYWLGSSPPRTSKL